MNTVLYFCERKRQNIIAKMIGEKKNEKRKIRWRILRFSFVLMVFSKEVRIVF